MAQKVRHLSGVQGLGPSSVTTTGYDKIFLTLVDDVWFDIQTSQKKWKWMRVSSSVFTQVGKTTYTPLEVFGPSHRFKKYYKDDFFITIDGKKTPLRFIEYEIFIRRHLNDSTNTIPVEFTIRESDDAIILPAPNAIFAVYFDYHKSAQTLSLATDTPEFDEDYHMIIVNGAVAAYTASISLQHVYQDYVTKYTKGYDRLLREQRPRDIYRVRGIA